MSKEVSKKYVLIGSDILVPASILHLVVEHAIRVEREWQSGGYTIKRVRNLELGEVYDSNDIDVARALDLLKCEE